jgi:hypothetical protein
MQTHAGGVCHAPAEQADVGSDGKNSALAPTPYQIGGSDRTFSASSAFCGSRPKLGWAPRAKQLMDNMNMVQRKRIPLNRISPIYTQL